MRRGEEEEEGGIPGKKNETLGLLLEEMKTLRGSSKFLQQKVIGGTKRRASSC